MLHIMPKSIKGKKRNLSFSLFIITSGISYYLVETQLQN